MQTENLTAEEALTILKAFKAKGGVLSSGFNKATPLPKLQTLVAETFGDVAEETTEVAPEFSDEKTSTEAGDELYRLEISVNDVEFETTAVSIQEALQAFVDSPDYPQGSKTDLVIVVHKGEKTTTRRIPVMIARRKLLSMKIKPITAEILAEELMTELQ